MPFEVQQIAPHKPPTPPAAALPGTGAPAAVPPVTPPAAPVAAKPDENSVAQLAIARRKAEKRASELEDLNTKQAKDLAVLESIRDPKKRFAAIEEHFGADFYEKYTEHKLGALQDDKPKLELPDDVRAKLAEVDELKKRLTDREATEAEARKQLSQNADHQAAKSLIDTSKDKYPFLHALDGAALVVQEFNRLAEENGEDPDANEIAASLEARTQENIEKQLTALAATARGRELLTKLIGQPASQPEPAVKRGLTTLTNDDAAAPGDEPDLSKLSPQQLRARALSKMKRATG